jgi:Cysteine rich repeat
METASESAVESKSLRCRPDRRLAAPGAAVAFPFRRPKLLVLIVDPTCSPGGPSSRGSLCPGGGPAVAVRSYVAQLPRACRCLPAPPGPHWPGSVVIPQCSPGDPPRRGFLCPGGGAARRKNGVYRASSRELPFDSRTAFGKELHMPHPSRPPGAAIVVAVFLLVSSLASVPTARAQQPGHMSAQMRKACMADYRKLCPGVRPGEGRVVACFEEHMRELSPG